MLYLARKEGESIIINNDITLTVVEVRGRTVKLGFQFPPEASILRKELYDKIMEQNLAATAAVGAEDFAGMEFNIDVPSHEGNHQEKPEKDTQESDDNNDKG